MGKYIPNKYNVYDDYVEIIVTSPKYGEFKVLIDLDDIEKCKQFHWMARKVYKSEHNEFYMGSYYNKKVLLIHRLIMNYNGKDVVDHINGDILDNRKSNLRICTYTQNQMNSTMFFKHNTSGHKGVFWNTFIPTPKWTASIGLNRKRIHIGYYDKLEDAIEARREKEEELFGEYSRQMVE